MRPIVLMMLGVLGSGCSRPNEGSAPTAASSAPATHEAPKKVRLSPEVIADAGIKTSRPVREALGGTVDLPGEVAADPDRSARIASPVAGRLEQVMFKEGSQVKKGEALATVRVPELGKIRSAHASTLARAKAARSNAERLKALRGQGLSGEQEVVNAEAEAQSLDAEARGLGEQLASMGSNATGSGALLTLRAPLTGVVLSRDAVAGQPVNPDQTIGSIADLSEVWFLGRVFERNLGQLRLGAKAQVRLDAFPQETFEGTVSYLGKQLDPVTRTLTARIQLTDPKDILRLGLYGTAHVLAGDTAQRPPSVVITRSAVVDMAGRTVVFVAVGTGEFEAHDVELGEGVRDRVEIKKGVTEADQVVIDGSFTIKSAFLKSTFAEEE